MKSNGWPEDNMQQLFWKRNGYLLRNGMAKRGKAGIYPLDWLGRMAMQAHMEDSEETSEQASEQVAAHFQEWYPYGLDNGRLPFRGRDFYDCGAVMRNGMHKRDGTFRRNGAPPWAFKRGGYDDPRDLPKKDIFHIGISLAAFEDDMQDIQPKRDGTIKRNGGMRRGKQTYPFDAGMEIAIGYRPPRCVLKYGSGNHIGQYWCGDPEKLFSMRARRNGKRRIGDGTRRGQAVKEETALC